MNFSPQAIFCGGALLLLSTGLAQAAPTAATSWPPAPELPDFVKTSQEKDSNALRSQQAKLLELLALPERNKDQWIEIVRSQGDLFFRRLLHNRLLEIKPFPVLPLVELLGHEELAVRLGALELLEERYGTDHAFNPWLPPDSPGNQAALQNWRRLAAQGAPVETELYAALSREEILRLIETAADDPSSPSAGRAARVLASGDDSTRAAILDFLDTHPELNPESRRLLREVSLRMLMPPLASLDPDDTARRLVHGDADTRARACSQMVIGGAASLPVLRETLSDPVPMVREAAADALLAAGGMDALSIIRDHLATEQDAEVIHAILRALGKIHTQRSAEMLLPYLNHANEDLALAALAGAEKFHHASLEAALVKALGDPRWRVRAAALSAVAALKIRAASDGVVACLDDPDEFVRTSAVMALPNIVDQTTAIKKLSDLFFRYDTLALPIIEAFRELDVSLPAAVRKQILSSPPDVLFGAVDIWAKNAAKNRDLLIEMASHENLDIACSALAGLAGERQADGKIKIVLTEALRSGVPEKQLAVLTRYRPQPSAPIGVPSREALPSREDSGPTALGRLLGAFFPAPPKSPPPAPAHTPRTDTPRPVDPAALAKAFHLEESPAASIASARAPMNPHAAMILALQSCSTNANPRVARAATLCLLRQDPAKYIPRIAADLNNYSLESQSEVADILEDAGPAALGLLTLMLSSPEQGVREQAAGSLLSYEQQAKGLAVVLDALVASNSILRVTDLPSYSLATAASTQMRTALLWTRSALDPEREIPVDTRCLALALLGGLGKKNNVETVTPWLTSEHPELRAAAWYALATLDTAEFRSRQKALLDDPSTAARRAYAAIFRGNDGELTIQLTDNRTMRLSGYSPFKTRPSITTPTPEEKDHLQKLLADPSPLLRYEAAIALFERRDNIPADQLYELVALQTGEDRERAASRLADALDNNAHRLDHTYIRLFPLIEKEVGDWRMQELRKNFAKKTAPQETNAITRVLRSDPANPTACCSNDLVVVFFFDPDCDECDEVEKWLAEARERHPRLVIERHDVRHTDAERLQVRYIRTTGADPAQTRITPYLVTAAGILGRNQLANPVLLNELLDIAATITDPAWHIELDEEATEPPPFDETAHNTDATDLSHPARLKRSLLFLLLLLPLLLVATRLRKRVL